MSTNASENGGVDVGEYNYAFEVKDALSALGTAGASGLANNGEVETADTDKITYNQKIRIIPQAIQPGSKTPCIVKGVAGALRPDSCFSSNRELFQVLTTTRAKTYFSMVYRGKQSAYKTKQRRYLFWTRRS